MFSSSNTVVVTVEGIVYLVFNHPSVNGSACCVVHQRGLPVVPLDVPGGGETQNRH